MKRTALSLEFVSAVSRSALTVTLSVLAFWGVAARPMPCAAAAPAPDWIVTEAAAIRPAPRGAPPVPAAPDPQIVSMVSEVAAPAVMSKIEWLAGFGTRYSFAPNRLQVAQAIYREFEGYGLAPVLRPFEVDGVTLWNIDVVQRGTVHPDSFFVICAHYDSFAGDFGEGPADSAPGADDNASGVAAVLTAAQILSRHEFEFSIRYVCFGAEEQGTRGSLAWCEWASARDLAVMGAINVDTIGYWNPDFARNLDIVTNSKSQWLATAVMNAASVYTDAVTELDRYDFAFWSDQFSFWYNGYPAIMEYEAFDYSNYYPPELNPAIHTPEDLPIMLDVDFLTENVQVGVAALAVLAVPVPAVTGVPEPFALQRAPGMLRAYPNPFADDVTLSLDGGSESGRVRLLVYDVLGRPVDELAVELHDGRGSARWRAPEVGRAGYSSGVYFVRPTGVLGAAPVKLICIR